ncbi:MAG TPA: serine hydrolase domain-containing protein [Bryobacteraceae bacterium]|nr:serine hydrolase domain-containing protein [Bryobacteraceae bacterium]
MKIRVLGILLLACAASPAGDYFPPPDGAGGWRSLRDAAKIRKIGGMDLAKLDQAFEYARRSSQHGGLLVVRHGWLVYEKYYGKGNREAIPAMASVGKAYTSIACGILLKDKHQLIPEGLEQKVFTKKYLPEALPLTEPAKAGIKLGHLLSMAAGFHGEGSNPGFVNFQPSVKLDPLPRPDKPVDQDLSALHTPLWTEPGGGYSYASSSPHVASIVLRHLAGMEMQQYIDEKLAKPMGWGPWGYATRRATGILPHTPGGGDIAVRSTDALRFAYLLLHQGRWGGKQLVPADYVALCGRPSPYQKHAPFSLMFEVNADGHVAGAPADAYFKSGGGGYGILVVPSLDLVIYKMAGSDSQYDPSLTGLAQTYKYDGSRDNWKPAARSQFSDGPIGTDDGVRRILEMVAAAVVE